MVLGRKAGVHEGLSPFAVNVRKRNQRRNSHIVLTEFEFGQMTKRGGKAGIIPPLCQHLSPILDLSERETPFGANTAEQRAKAFHVYLQTDPFGELKALPLQRMFSLSIPGGLG
jgi:hypothetical protein